MKHLRDREFRRILIVKPSSLGDVIHALPVLHGLRRRYPDAHITWMLANGLVELLDGHPELNDVLPFDRKHYGKLGRQVGASRDFLSFLKDLRARRFDLVLDLQGLFRSGFFTRATGAPTRIGFGDAREFSRWFYTHRVPVPLEDTHAAERIYGVSQLLGFDDLPMTCDLALTDDERRAAADVLTDAGVDGSRPIAAVVPGARWETKRWPPAHFAALCDRLHDERGFQVVLLGAPDEQPLARAITSAAAAPLTDLAGRTRLRTLVALIDAAALVVTNDSGTKDIASALSRPLVCLYGPTSPVRTGPMLGRGRVVRLDIECSPCYFKRLAQCPHNHRCLETLTPAQVLDAIDDLPVGPAPVSDIPLGSA